MPSITVSTDYSWSFGVPIGGSALCRGTLLTNRDCSKKNSLNVTFSNRVFNNGFSKLCYKFNKITFMIYISILSFSIHFEVSCPLGICMYVFILLQHLEYNPHNFILPRICKINLFCVRDKKFWLSWFAG